MRGLMVLLAFLGWVGAAQAQDAQAIEDVIGRQLDAFNDRDIAEAWGYASPTIQRLFGNSDNFGRMVQEGYPMVWSNRNPRFTDLEEQGDARIQSVIIEDIEGGLHVLDYMMIPTAEGWRINGVQIRPAPQLGV